MFPSLMQSYGGQLYYMQGARIIPLNNLFEVVEVVNEGGASAPDIRNRGASDEKSTIDTWNVRYFGGFNTYYPASYANHKSLAIYKGFAYQALNRINANASFGLLYISRFDGSGIFVNEGNVNYETKKWSNGRGSEMLSPSGTSHNTRSNDMGLLSYNSNLFIGGTIFQKHAVASNAWTDLGWTYVNESLPIDRSDRRYTMMAITDDNKKIVTAGTQFTPDANVDEHLHTCDMIGFRDDVYYANWIDVVKFNGGSGAVSLIDTDLKTPSSKSFATFPQGGYDSGDGSSVGETFLLYQDGSGVIKKINTTRESPSGASTIVDLGTGLGTSVRPYDNFRTRIDSAINEPGRSNLLINFNNQLHSFIPTATSGYQHFSCTGAPSGITNWTSKTTFLPTNLKIHDSNVFGYVDDFRNKLYIAQVTMGEVGVVGHAGIARGAGGVFVNELNVNGVWKEINRSVPGLIPRSFIPYNNFGPYITIPSGNNPVVLKCSDYAILEYKAHDFFKRQINVDLEYSLDDGNSWNIATRFKTYNTNVFLGSGTTGLATNQGGIDYNFYWHYINDIGFNNLQNILLRIKSKLKR